MAVVPATLDLRIQKRSDWSIQVTFKDSEGTAVDLTGWTIASEVWDKGRTNLYATMSTELVDAVNGLVKLSLDRVQTEALPSRAQYDVALTNTEDIKEYYIEGTIVTSEGYTA